MGRETQKITGRYAAFGDGLMIEIKSMFVADNQNTFAALKDAIAKKDIKSAHRIAHSLKSGAATIEQYRLQEAALAVETAIDEENGEVPNELLGELETAMNDVLEELAPFKNAAAQSSVKKKRENTDDDTLLSDELEKLLRKGNPRAIEYADALRSEEEYKELVKFIDNYDFDDALDLFLQLKEKF